MMPVIRVSSDVYEDLKKLATPFEDSPSSVIRRLLDEQNTRKNSTKRVVRTANSHIRAPRTPLRVFRRLILDALVDLGGSASVTEVVDRRVYEQVKNKLTDFDLAVLDGGEARWRNTARWARKSLVEEGLMSGHRGEWVITAKGREELRRLSRKSD